MGLLDDILRVHHLTFIIDRGGAGDEDLTTVCIIHVGSTFKGDPIVTGTVQVGRGVQIVYLFLLHTCDGIVVHL